MASKFDPKAATRGLAKAMTEAQPDEVILNLPVDRIEADPNQPRKSFDPKYIESLSASIEKNGQQSAIIVRRVSGNPKIDYRIVFGERRWRACKFGGRKTVRAVIRELTDEDAAQIYSAQAAENFGQHAMTLPEQIACALRMSQLFGAAEAVERMGLPKSDVSKLTTIGKAEGATQVALEAGYTESLETLYLLARVQKKDAPTADRLVSSWADPDKRLGARGQVKTALDRLSASADDDAGADPRRPSRRSAPTDAPAGGSSRGRSADDSIPVQSVERAGKDLLLHTETAGTLRVKAESLLAVLATAGLIPSAKG